MKVTVGDLLGPPGTDVRPGGRELQPWPSPGTRWVVGVAAGVAFATALGLLISDQVTERGRFDRDRTSLMTTRRDIATVSSDLATLRHDLDVLTTQLGSDTTALDQDASQLRGAQTALAATQAHVTAQASQITALHTCLDGVEQALNALSVGKVPRALALLSSVSASCSAAAASSG